MSAWMCTSVRTRALPRHLGSITAWCTPWDGSLCLRSPTLPSTRLVPPHAPALAQTTHRHQAPTTPPHLRLANSVLSPPNHLRVCRMWFVLLLLLWVVCVCRYHTCLHRKRRNAWSAVWWYRSRGSVWDFQSRPARSAQLCPWAQRLQHWRGVWQRKSRGGGFTGHQRSRILLWHWNP